MPPQYERLQKCYEIYKEKIHFEPRVALVLGASCGACSELLLILPDDDLRRKRIIVIIRSGNRGIQTLLPAVYRCEHNALACGSRQILKISAVAAAG